MFSALTASLLKDAQPALAQPLSGPVPEVDRLSVRVVVDAYQIAVAPNVKKDDVEVQRFGWGLSDKTPSGTLRSEFGLALHVEAGRGDQTRNVLVDFGFTPEALLNNLELLRIDPARLDALVLSHGHYDHFGGLVGFLGRYNAKLKPRLPLYVGGEDCFCSRQWTAPPQPDRNIAAIAAANPRAIGVVLGGHGCRQRRGSFAQRQNLWQRHGQQRPHRCGICRCGWPLSGSHWTYSEDAKREQRWCTGWRLRCLGWL